MRDQATEENNLSLMADLDQIQELIALVATRPPRNF